MYEPYNPQTLALRALELLWRKTHLWTLRFFWSIKGSRSFEPMIKNPISSFGIAGPGRSSLPSAKYGGFRVSAFRFEMDLYGLEVLYGVGSPKGLVRTLQVLGNWSGHAALEDRILHRNK